ncbi:MAG: hypothetical protein ACKVKG_00495 [Alphaproteobacteria bacterium]|jgi:hypothetical protein
MIYKTFIGSFQFLKILSIGIILLSVGVAIFAAGEDTEKLFLGGFFIFVGGSISIVFYGYLNRWDTLSPSIKMGYLTAVP